MLHGVRLQVYRDYFYTCLAYCVTGILRCYVFQHALPRALNIICSEQHNLYYELLFVIIR